MTKFTGAFKSVAALCIVCAFIVSAASGVGAGEWPSRGIELIAPFRAGGDTDFHARTYAKYLERELGQSVAVVNVDGAAGTIGAQQVASSAPNGYRMLFYHTGNLFVNKLMGAADLDHTFFDIACIGVLDDTAVFVTKSDSGITTAQDLIAKAKAAPDKISAGVTISGFSYFVLAKAQAGGDFSLHPVDYGNAASLISALLGNHVQLVVNSYGVFKQYIDSKDMVPLMVASENRNPSFPDVPTVGEIGLKDAVAARAYFFAFPKGTDPQIVKKLSDAVGRIYQNPEYAAEIKNAYCVVPFYRDVTTATQYIEGLWQDILKYEDILLRQ